MNTLLNTTLRSQHQTDKGMYGSHTKRDFSLQPESLFSMALYDMDFYSHQQQQQQPLLNQPQFHHQQQQQHQQQQHQQQQLLEPLAALTAPAFYPVDEYKDLSLRELLDLSDDYLFADGEENVNTNAMLNPIPLNVPVGQNVASHAAHNSSYIEPVVSSMPMMGNMLAANQMEDLNDIIEPTPIKDPQMPTYLEIAIPMVASSSDCVNNNNNKRHREVSDDDLSDTEDMNNEGRFRPYQAGQWAERFADLCQYRERHNNCLVPHTYKENLPLARWVKRQRYQYKLMVEGKSSTMTEERVKALEEIGFIWDSQGAAWGERLEELKEFRSIYGHTNVPSNFSENPQLATWVKCQRRQYKLYKEGKPSNMTPQRINDLEVIGFEWLLRSYKKQRTN